MNATEYNGWTNYETWMVNLWLMNDESSYNRWTQFAADFASSEPVSEELLPHKLGDAMSEALSEDNPLNPENRPADLWSDLIESALAEVNWSEIAESFLLSSRA